MATTTIQRDGTRDPGEAVKFAAVALAIAGGAGVIGSLAETGLSRRRRLALLSGSVTATAFGTQVVRRPALGEWAMFKQPEATLVSGTFAVLVSPLMGRRFNALHLLTITGTGFAAAVLDRKHFPHVAAAATAFWVAQAGQSLGSFAELRADEKRAMTFGMVPLAFVAVARLAPDAFRAAREFDHLDEILALVEARLEDLADYRELLEHASASVQRAFAITADAVDRIEDEAARAEARTQFVRTVGRLDERTAVLEAATPERSNLRSLLEGRRHAALHTGPDIPVIEIIAPALDVQDGRALALLASATAGGISNAIRHARGLSHIEVALTQVSGSMELCVRDDGLEGAVADHVSFKGDGLGHLELEASAQGGSMTWGPDAGGGWCQRLRLPLVGEQVNVDRQRLAQETNLLLDAALRDTTRLCAAMVLLMAVDGLQLRPGPLKRLRALALTVPVIAVYEAMDQRGALRAREHGFLGGVVAVSAISLHGEHSLWAGWYGSALSRFALHGERAQVHSLAAAHSAAMAISYRGGWREAIKMTAHQIGAGCLGPVSLTAGASRAIRALDAKEIALQDAITRTEQLHALAESFDERHSPLEALEDLRDLMKLHDAKSHAALDQAGTEYSSAKYALPETSSAAAFVEEFAKVVAARIWPVEVDLQMDVEALDELGQQAAVQLAFRRPALAVATRLGDEYLRRYPKNWRGRRPLTRLRLIVRADQVKRTLHIKAVPQQRKAAADHSDELASAVARAEGVLKDGFEDGQLRIVLPLETSEVIDSQNQ